VLRDFFLLPFVVCFFSSFFFHLREMALVRNETFLGHHLCKLKKRSFFFKTKINKKNV